LFHTRNIKTEEQRLQDYLKDHSIENPGAVMSV